MTTTRIVQAQQWFLGVLAITVVLVLVYTTRFDASLKTEPKPPPILPDPDPRKKVTVTFWGRNGNHMFEYSTLIGAAKRNNMSPIVVESTTIWNMFKLPIPRGSVENLDTFRRYKEKLPSGWCNMTEKLDTSHGAYLMGYLQSWRYFENVREELLKKHFVFHDHLKKAAMDYINNVRKERKKQKATLVAVHVRRGDFVRQKRKGYTVAPIPYFYRAMNYFRKKYKNVLFILCSNDVIWSMDNLDDSPDVHYSHNTDGYLDFAIMASCDHMIMSAGSYSWWAGYLCGGDVIYYHGYPQPNTVMGNNTIRADYYPPWWIPL
ncbi:galactoside alpha-(1,2)-fucosyltransferase 2-like [Ostrea edulis]|uniref:galactoside alpha-(1,2)-fucosyltransferase 2-like n=1 Tax=Ostrea edulis TaxID=37623 RepID=UPI0020940E49|nr:galactoside alpha-(1,2)-fucosyltransferase 2-like [Ostrea edulis]